MRIIPQIIYEIINIVYQLKSGFSKGANDISSKIIKGLINEKATPLSVVFNKPLQFHQFPANIK